MTLRLNLASFPGLNNDVREQTENMLSIYMVIYCIVLVLAPFTDWQMELLHSLLPKFSCQPL